MTVPVSSGARRQGEPGPVPGQAAPDFTLSNQFGEPVTLSALRGSNVVVVFYPFAFSGICTGELCELRDNLADFRTAQARLLAVSVDSKYTLRAYAAAEKFDFDLLADFWPHGAVASSYGVFNPERGMAERGSFIIDADGILRSRLLAPVAQGRPMDDYRRALAKL
ncbi:MAG: peroxiredoxin [Actinomycetales bacterium]